MLKENFKKLFVKTQNKKVQNSRKHEVKDNNF